MRGLEPFAGGLDTDELHVVVVQKSVERSHRVRAAANAGDDGRGQSSGPLEHLRPRFTTDDRLEIAHHSRVRRGADNGPDDIVAVVDVRNPITDRFRRGVLESPRAARHAYDGRPHEAHAIDVERLAPHVFLAHVYDALEPEPRA